MVKQMNETKIKWKYKTNKHIIQNVFACRGYEPMIEIL